MGDPNSLHTRRWVGWFADRGHAVHLIDPFGAQLMPGFPPTVAVAHYRAHRIHLPLISLVLARRDLRRLLGRLEVQVLHGHFVRRYGWQAALSGFRPLVISPWGSDILRASRRALRTRWWNRFALRSADLVTVSSEAMRRAAVAAGARADRVELVHHGVDTATFSGGNRDETLAARLGVGRAAVILSPRSIRPLYRQEVVVDAVARVVATGRDLVLVMSARGADPMTLAGLRERASAGGIADRLRILEDVAHEELPALLRLADVVVSVPESDSFPVTLLEAMACERPIVASNLPAVAPVLADIDDTARALVVPVGDAAATAAAIVRAMELDPDDRRAMGRRLRAHVVQTADYNTNMARMEHLYRSLATGR